MVRVSATAVNPMSDIGDMVIGGAGSSTGEYEAVSMVGAVATASSQTGAEDPSKAIDGNEASGWVGAGAVTGSWLQVVLAEAKQIGRWRIRQGSGSFDFRRAAAYRLQYSSDGVSWVDAYNYTGGEFYDHTLELPSPITSRIWRLLAHSSTDSDWIVNVFELWSAETVGRGNQTRLAAPDPAERRVLIFDDGALVPAWLAPAAANPDTSGAVLADLETEVNQIKAALRAAGIIAT